MKKRLIGTVIAFICIFNIFTVPVNAESKKKITKPIVTYMKAARSYNPDKMKMCFIKKPTYAYAKYYKNLFKKNNRKYLSYKITMVKVRKKTAMVKVKVVQPDYYVAFAHAYYNYVDWYMDYYYINGKQPSSSAVGNKLNQSIKKCIKKYGMQKKNRTVTFNLQKTSVGWKIKNGTKRIKDIASMRMYQAIEDAQDCWEKEEDINEYIELFK